MAQTHYAYRIECVPNSTKTRDVATRTYNLMGTGSYRRRKLIAELRGFGEYLAKLPLKFDMIDDDEINLDELTCFINGEFY